MCGIVGFAYSDTNRQVDRDTLARMRKCVAHRGPDGSGEHFAHGVGLGHTRLSVIDIENSGQPMANEDESVWVTFNGEIYNYRELREELANAGHIFRTLGDTEVLVHGYEQWGDGVVERLNGMFAFALHDLRQQRLLLARDHLGIKPLFYALTNDALVFASEIKAVLAGANIAPEPDLEGLVEYLTFRYVVRPRTFFRNIRGLPPGNTAVWADGNLEIREYWPPSHVENISHITEAQATEELHSHLTKAVKTQMMSDVPLGAFCSGGVDSGIVTAYAARASSHPLHTFSVGFKEEEWDESSLAKKNAARAGSIHHSVYASADNIPSLIRDLIWYNDEPLSHPNSVPIYILSRMARQYVTVALTGEGADELLGGYPRYQIARLAGSRGGRLLYEMSPAIRRALAASLQLLPSHRARRVCDLLPLSFEDAVIYNSAYCDPVMVKRLTGIQVDDILGHRRNLLSRSLVQGDPLATISRYEASTYLGCALDRMDRMSMANGLEGRVPFLDMPLVEWSLALPSSLKMQGLSTKRVLKFLASTILDPSVVYGRKSGFGLPLDEWFRSAAFRPIMALLENRDHPAARYFNADTIRALVIDHRNNVANNGEILWLVANVFIWVETHQSP